MTYRGSGETTLGSSAETFASFAITASALPMHLITRLRIHPSFPEERVRAFRLLLLTLLLPMASRVLRPLIGLQSRMQSQRSSEDSLSTRRTLPLAPTARS